MLDGEESSDVAAFLTARPGAESGMMIAQYTAAGLLAESIADSSISAHSITVLAGQEDIHSMGTIATRALRQQIEKSRYILAIELLCAIRWYQLASDRSPSDPLMNVIDCIEESVNFPQEDTQLSDTIAATAKLIAEGSLEEAVAQTDVRLE